MPQDDRRRGFRLRELVQGGSQREVLVERAHVVRDHHVRPLDDRPQVRDEPVPGPGERPRDPTGSERGSDLGHDRVQRIHQRHRQEPDAGPGPGSPARHDRDRMPGVRHQARVLPQHALYAAHDGRGGVMDEDHPHGASPKHSSSSARSRCSGASQPSLLVVGDRTTASRVPSDATSARWSAFTSQTARQCADVPGCSAARRAMASRSWSASGPAVWAGIRSLPSFGLGAA